MNHRTALRVHPGMRLAGVALVLLGTVAEAGARPIEIGIIDFYGRHRTSAEAARGALTFKEGDSFDLGGSEPPEAFRTTAERLKKLPDVLHVNMSGLVCCDAGRWILYIGIEERGAPALNFRQAPKGTERLPADVVAAGDRFMNAFTEAIQRGDSGEDRSQGHSLSRDPATRAVQEEFPAFARRDAALLRRVLRKSSEPQHRALAAQVLGYSQDKQAVVDDLVRAMRDPDEGVRNNSMRALILFAEAAPVDGKPVARVPAAPFVEFLHSPEWTDRNKSVGALSVLTAARDPEVLAEIRRSAVAPLIEMAQWKSEGHAEPAVLILARLAGKTDEAARRLWHEGNLRAVIDAAMACR